MVIKPCIYFLKFCIFFKIHFMLFIYYLLIYYQCWKPVVFFSGLLDLHCFQKLSICLKYNFCNNIC